MATKVYRLGPTSQHIDGFLILLRDEDWIVAITRTTHTLGAPHPRRGLALYRKVATNLPYETDWEYVCGLGSDFSPDEVAGVAADAMIKAHLGMHDR